MALVFQEGQALGQGITQAGTALGQALQQSQQQQQKNALQQALSQQKYQQDLQLYKEKEAIKLEGSKGFISGVFNRTEEDAASVGGEVPQEQIEGVSEPSTLPERVKQLPAKDAAPTNKYQINEPGIGPVDRRQIDELLVAPYEQARNLGKALDQRWNEEHKQNSKENAEIRKEYRKEISDYAKDYSDLSKLNKNLNKFKEAEKLIKSGKVSVDGNFVRNVAVAYLEGNESQLSELVKTNEQQQLFYLLRDALKTKDVGGANPSTREVLISMSTLPNPYKGQQANEYIIKNMINESETQLHKAKEINKIRGDDPNITFPNFLRSIEESTLNFMDEKQKLLHEEFDNPIKKATSGVKSRGPAAPGNVWVMAPDGKIGQIPKDKIEHYESIGGVVINE